MIPATEVPKWVDFLNRWRKDFSADDIEHKNLMNIIGLVGYEVACLRWVVGSMFSKQHIPPPIRDRYMYFVGEDAPSAESSTRPGEHPYERVTREEFANMSDSEKKDYQEWKSAIQLELWQGSLGGKMNTAAPKKAS